MTGICFGMNSNFKYAFEEDLCMENKYTRWVKSDWGQMAQSDIFIAFVQGIYTGGLISQWEKRRGGVPANQGLVLLAVAG